MGLLDGFSDFVKTPEGQGLLAATFGGLAGAQRGAPINSLGRAGLAGLSGYGNAQDRETKAEQIAQQKKLQDMQMAQILQKDDAPIPVPAGTVLWDRRTSAPIFTAPAKSEKDDPKITQYEYAKQNGYKGTFEQFVTLGPTIMAAAQAPLRAAQVSNIYEENAYNLPPPRPAPAARPRAPMRGQVVQGYKFKGGNPADQSNWEKQ